MMTGDDVLRYIGKKLLLGIVLIICVSFLVFSMIFMMPGDPVTLMAGELANQDKIAETVEKYGLNRRHRGYQYLRACHSDDGRCGCRNAIDFHGHITLVVHEHIVDLRCSHAVAAGRVDPHGNISAAGHELVLEKLRGDIIVKPAFLGDGPVQEQRPFRHLRFVLPIPELFHQVYPPLFHR